MNEVSKFNASKAKAVQRTLPQGLLRSFGAVERIREVRGFRNLGHK